MKYFVKFLFPIVTLVLLQSCEKEGAKDEVIKDNFTYGVKFNWREDAIKTENADWTKVAKGNVFSWLAQDNLQSSNFATYSDRTNIKADFHYTIQKDSVFVLRLSSDSVYFLDEKNNRRTDIKGKITFSPDTSLILHNTAISPAISIKYNLEK